MKSKSTKSTSIEDVKAFFRQDSEYRKAERLVNPYYELAAKIINLRARLNLTQKELAERAETHQSRISKIESGEHDIRLSTLTRIAEALECRVLINLVPNQELIETNTEPYKFLFPNASVATEDVRFSEEYVAEANIGSSATVASNIN